MSPASQRIQAAIETQLDRPTAYADLADAACAGLFEATDELQRQHPEYSDAFQALAEHLGYV